MNTLSNKVVVITGGSSGMGLATARLFVQEGASVVITGRREKELAEAVKSIGGNIYGFQGDISSLGDLEKLRAFVAEKFGQLDVILANAGGGALGPFGSVSEADFDRTVNMNVKGTFFTVRTLLPLLKDGSSIILNASIAATKGLPAFTVYSATKAAIRSFSRTWTTDLAPRKIVRENRVTPSSSSSSVIMREAVGCESLSSLAALEKLAVRVSRTNLQRE